MQNNIVSVASKDSASHKFFQNRVFSIVEEIDERQDQIIRGYNQFQYDGIEEWICVKSKLSQIGIDYNWQSREKIASTFPLENKKQVLDYYEYYDSIVFDTVLFEYLQNFDLDFNELERSEKIEYNYILKALIKDIKNDYFPCVSQYYNNTCGPTCLHLIGINKGLFVDLNFINYLCQIDSTGTTISKMSKLCAFYGFETIDRNFNYKELFDARYFPFIAYFNQNHFVVVNRMEKDSVWISDPGKEKTRYKMSSKDFCNAWTNSSNYPSSNGHALFIGKQDEYGWKKFRNQIIE